MSEAATSIPDQTQNEPIVAPPNINEQIANSLWGENPTPSPAAIPANDTPPPVVEELKVPTVVEETEQIFDVDDYFKNNFGVDAATAKNEWESLRKLKETPPVVEPQYANEESKRLHDLIKAGKTNEVYQFLDQQMQLDRFEQYDINNIDQAAEIIKANLKFKHKELSPQQINRLFERQYTMPTKPVQSEDQEDADYAVELEGWKRQVQEKEQDMMIDATLAKPELLKYKSQIVLPDIPEVKNDNQLPDQKELEAKQLEFIENFKKSLERDYQNFKGFSVTAIDGDVQLPISYAITPEELTASKEMVANFNLNDFFDQRWFDKQGVPNITQIQEDVYLLVNRDKIHQKIANEASAQRALHEKKIQNNIKLDGVNPALVPPSLTNKTPSERVAETIWSM